MRNLSEYLQIITTTPSRADALELADTLIRTHLAPCFQIIGPILSIFSWKDKIEKSEEWLCLIKTRNDYYKDVEKAILEVHPYDVPEILAVPILEANEDYLTWMNRELIKNPKK